MKHLISLLIAALLLSAYNADDTCGLQWKTTVCDFGKVKRDSILETRFVCRNVSDSVIYIENIVSSCGCTVADWNKKPIYKGDSCIIAARFNTSGKKGKHSKYFAVYTSKGLCELLLKADIHK